MHFKVLLEWVQIDLKAFDFSKVIGDGNIVVGLVDGQEARICWMRIEEAAGSCRELELRV